MVEYIQDARESIHLAVYTLSMDVLARELIIAHEERGVQVKVITDDQ